MCSLHVAKRGAYTNFIIYSYLFTTLVNEWLVVHVNTLWSTAKYTIESISIFIDIT